MKICKGCNTNKNESEFHFDNSTKDNLCYLCKPCKLSYGRATKEKIRKSKKGVISRIYETQVTCSKKRGHKPPSYPKQYLKEWLLDQKLFHILYNNWVNSNYDINLKPSVDRIESDQGYLKSNIQLMTWDENNKKGRVERLNKLKLKRINNGK